MGVTAATKTANSDRIIKLDDRLIDILKLLPSRELGLEQVFVNKRGEPMSKKWAENYWKAALKRLGIRHRKFYATRHTAITEMVREGQNLKAIADHMGTSYAMIEQNYCARQGLNIKSHNSSTGDMVSSEEDSFQGKDNRRAPRCESDPR